MSISKHNFEQTPPNGMTSGEFNHFNTKLSESVASKVQSGTLKLAHDSDDIEMSELTSINLSRYGLRNYDDLRKFLLTPAGETVIHEIAKKITLEKINEEERQQQIQEQIMLEERKRALLFHWLLSEEAEAKKAQDELIELQNEQLQNEKQNAQQKTSEPTSNKGLQDTLKGYDNAIKAHQHHHKELAKNEKTLNEKLKGLTKEKEAITKKYDTYNKGFESFDNKQYEQYNDAALSKEIDKLEAQKKSKPSEQNEINLQGLHEIRGKQRGEKIFVDANGNTEGVKHKDAAFVLSKAKGQTLVKHNDQFHLLERGENWADVVKDPDKMKQAQARFEHAKPDIMSVRNKIQHAAKQELALNATQTEETQKKLSENKAEQLMVKNQISSLQSARANAHKTMLKPTPGVEMQAPKSTIISGLSTNPIPLMPSPPMNAGSSKVSHEPAPQITAAAFIQTEIDNMGKNFNKGAPNRLGWDDLSKIIDKIPDKDAKDAANKFINHLKPKPTPNERELAEMLRNPPIPPVVMQSLLRHMSTLSLDPYNPTVSAEENPSQIAHKTPSPSNL